MKTCLHGRPAFATLGQIKKKKKKKLQLTGHYTCFIFELELLCIAKI